MDGYGVWMQPHLLAASMFLTFLLRLPSVCHTPRFCFFFCELEPVSSRVGLQEIVIHVPWVILCKVSAQMLVTCSLSMLQTDPTPEAVQCSVFYVGLKCILPWRLWLSFHLTEYCEVLPHPILIISDWPDFSIYSLFPWHLSFSWM